MLKNRDLFEVLDVLESLIAYVSEKLDDVDDFDVKKVENDILFLLVLVSNMKEVMDGS